MCASTGAVLGQAFLTEAVTGTDGTVGIAGSKPIRTVGAPVLSFAVVAAVIDHGKIAICGVFQNEKGPKLERRLGKGMGLLAN